MGRAQAALRATTPTGVDSVLLSGGCISGKLVVARHQKAKESSLMRRSGPGWLLLESDYPDSLEWLVLFL